MNARSLIIHIFNHHKSLSFTTGEEKRREKNNVATAIKCCEIISCLYSLLCTLYMAACIIHFSILITAQACIHKTTQTAL